MFLSLMKDIPEEVSEALKMIVFQDLQDSRKQKSVAFMIYDLAM